MKHLAKKICIPLLIFSITISSIKAQEIHKAVKAGDLSKVQELIEADSTLIEIIDTQGNTPLNLACFDEETWKKQPTIAKFLIDAGANVNTKNKFGNTPLHAVCLGSGPDFVLVQLLVANGADINAKNNHGGTPLNSVVTLGYLEVANFMIKHGADVNNYDSVFNSNVLNLAISFNKNDSIAKLLIENGARIDHIDSDGNTELHLAAMRGFADLIRLLLEKGADIHAVNQKNHTALYYAAKHGYRHAAEALIEGGADKSTIMETNYDKAQQLFTSLDQGEAYIWYVESGNVVKTKNHLLLFCPPIIDESLEAGLANGRLNPNELNGQNITIFTSYQEREPFKSWRLSFAERMPDVNWVFKTNEKSIDSPEILSYHILNPNDNLSIDGIQVYAIPGVQNGKAEYMAYFVEVDGVKIFYGRDHVSTNRTPEVEMYHKEIDFLKTFEPIDIAFLRVRGHFTNDYEPYLYLLDQLSPKAIYLTGGEGTFSEYLKCAELLQTRNIPVYYPEGRIPGDRFQYLCKSK